MNIFNGDELSRWSLDHSHREPEDCTFLGTSYLKNVDSLLFKPRLPLKSR